MCNESEKPLSNKLNPLVTPGTGVNILVNSERKDIVNLMKSYVIVFCGGANAVGYNNTQLVLKYITDFVKDCSHNNIILPSVPRLLESSCVNNELDQEINEICKNFKHTTVLEMREYLNILLFMDI
jgi:hypothetical protein